MGALLQQTAGATLDITGLNPLNRAWQGIRCVWDERSFLVWKLEERRGRGVLSSVLFTLACLILPVIWGALVNWLFNLWQAKAAGKEGDESIFPDYQI
jgi:hypothetical protein